MSDGTMSNVTTSWDTQDPPGLLWFEQINYVSVAIGSISYGVHIMVFFMTAYYLIKENKRGNWRWLGFIFVLFGLGTLNICFNLHFNQMAWVDKRNFPGGPLAFLLTQQNVPINIAGNAISAVIPFLADGLLIYRVHVVWNRWYVVAVPVIAWLVTFAFGILTTVQAAGPNSGIWAKISLNFSKPYFILSFPGLGPFLTLLLLSRLLYMRHKIVSTLGVRYGRVYASVAAMLIESAIPFGLISFTFIGLYAAENMANLLLLPTLVQVQCIGPMLIILRVARGRALSANSISEAQMTAIRFANVNVEPASSIASKLCTNRAQENV